MNNESIKKDTGSPCNHSIKEWLVLREELMIVDQRDMRKDTRKISSHLEVVNDYLIKLLLTPMLLMYRKEVESLVVYFVRVV